MVLTLSNEGHFTNVLPNASPQRRAFSQIITEISSGFEEIYNQAFFAEQYALNQVSGVGYRKALEFLVKDYLLSQTDDEAARENIKNKFLNNCIQDDVKNENIRQVARRAVWLGNDETHYVRKWADKDVNNLKQLIDLTIRWIENEVETRRVLAEMQ